MPKAKNGSQSAAESILRNPSSSGSDGDQADTKKKTSKSNRSVTFSLGDKQSTPTSPNGSDTSSLPVKGLDAATAMSSRATRSMRRQAITEKDPVKKGSAIKKGTSKKLMDANLKKDYAKANSSSSKNMKKVAGDKDEEVVKVKLNTGTLYLYKGLDRRAVFVRRV